MASDDKRAALFRRLDAMGITTYVRRSPGSSRPSSVPSAAQETLLQKKQAGQSAVPPASAKPGGTVNPSRAKEDDNYPTPEWAHLAKEVKNCEQCVLHEGRTQTVFGVGDFDADWMFIGEGPGAEEDRRGEPFVGRAGKLLDRMILALGLTRQQVYIANVVKCRPPDNRNPRPEEIVSCGSYLRRQIRMVQPKMIVCLGGVAAQTMLNTETTVGKLRGYEHSYRDDNQDDNNEIPLFVTYHPAYLLRSPNQKKAAWEDLQLASARIGHKIPERK